jgi:hypothetical protein
MKVVTLKLKIVTCVEVWQNIAKEGMMKGLSYMICLNKNYHKKYFQITATFY